ncbi:MAG: hypothetical protein KIT43_06705 [Bauldia sp.]|nr:hypothetical protein [Bauldia sp.]MCW5717310.1 hypothetical protein [Bauldia sp.]
MQRLEGAPAARRDRAVARTAKGIGKVLAAGEVQTCTPNVLRRIFGNATGRMVEG